MRKPTFQSAITSAHISIITTACVTLAIGIFLLTPPALAIFASIYTAAQLKTCSMILIYCSTFCSIFCASNIAVRKMQLAKFASKKAKKLSDATKRYLSTSSKINKDCELINQALDQLSSDMRNEVTASNQVIRKYQDIVAKLRPANSVIHKVPTQKAEVSIAQSECKIMLSDLSKAFKSYPKFPTSDHTAKEIEQIRLESIKHHNQVKLLVTTYIEQSYTNLDCHRKNAASLEAKAMAFKL